MHPWLHYLLAGALLRAVLGVTQPPPTTATPGALATPAAATAATAAPDYWLAEEPWFPYRELLLECLPQMSWPCAQRKVIVYLDRLNRARSVSVLGDLLQLVKVRPDTAPPITEAQLTARRIDRDPESLYQLLELAADRFVDTHVLRVNVPSLEGGVLRVTPLDVTFVTAEDPPASSRVGRGKKGGGGGGKMKKKGGKMMMKMMAMAGKKMMEMMGKMMLGKMMMMVPIAMKKGMIGGMAGLMSMGMMKMMLLQKIIMLIKQKLASCGGGGGGGGGGGYGGGGGGGDCGGGGGGGGYGGGGGGGGWDRTYNANQAYQPYSQNYNHPYVYYYQHPPEQNNDGWSLWKRR